MDKVYSNSLISHTNIQNRIGSCYNMCMSGFGTMPQLIGIKQEALPTLFTVQKPVPNLTSRFCTSLLWGACKLTKSNEPTVPARGEEGMPAVFLCATTPFLSENQVTTAMYISVDKSTVDSQRSRGWTD